MPWGSHHLLTSWPWLVAVVVIAVATERRLGTHAHFIVLLETGSKRPERVDPRLVVTRVGRSQLELAFASPHGEAVHARLGHFL